MTTLYQNLTENKLKFSKCYELNFSQKSLPGLYMKKLSNATQTCREIGGKRIDLPDYACL